MAMLGLENIDRHPYGSLTITFLLWKVLGLILALLSPGPGYDTSTDLLFSLDITHNHHQRVNLFQSIAHSLSLKLVRWDAIYFVSAAKHGYIYEQQWAFSWALAWFIRSTTKCKEW